LTPTQAEQHFGYCTLEWKVVAEYIDNLDPPQ
jgi:hypothetical protein